ncbi:MAG: hypothetical protein PVF58_22625 [Candidatus Methanofastidiosia archaeon]|jgi:hypothetical protein
MKQIRFSHEDYEKFQKINKNPPFTAQLIQVFLLQSNDITGSFKEYDTKYYTETSVQYYPLRGRLQIVLLLLTKEGLLFTTMRSANTSKFQYYQDAQGDEFEIITTRY